MEFSNLDRYSRYLTAVAIAVALLTFWRFRNMEFATVYTYVAHQSVIHSNLFDNLSSERSLVWDFFGLIDRMATPGSIDLLRLAGLVLSVVDFVLVALMLDIVLGQKVWGFLIVFLLSLSPPAVVSAVTGGPAAAAAAIVVLYMVALYRNEYMFAGLLSAVGFASSLPGLVMFLIVVLDLLQNSRDTRNIMRTLVVSAIAFFAVAMAVFAYKLYAGEPGFATVPVGDRDLDWNRIGMIPLYMSVLFNLIGVTYLIVKRRYDVYRSHFHAFMMWITMCAMSMVHPNTLNIFSASAISLAITGFFLQGFASLWKVRFISAGTFVVLIAVLFLSADMLINGKYLSDEVQNDSFQTNLVADQVSVLIQPMDTVSNVMTNFAPAELAFKIGRPVREVESDFLPVEGIPAAVGPSLYVVDSGTRLDTTAVGCRALFTTTFSRNGKNRFVQVIDCGGSK